MIVTLICNRYCRRLSILALVGLLCPVAGYANAIAASTQPGPGQSAAGDDSNLPRVNMVLRLGASEIQTLKTRGAVQATVPLELRDRIDGVRIGREYSFLDQVHRSDVEIDKLGDSVFVKLDDAVVDRLEYQPLVAKIYYSNYSRIVFQYSGEDADPRKSQRRVAGSRWFARIDDHRGLSGTLPSIESMTLQTDFGQLEIEIDQLRGIRFNAGEDAARSVAVELTNGDRFAGEISMEQLQLQCSWGAQSLKLAELESLTRDPDTRFQPDQDSPTGWRLKGPSAIQE